MPTPRAFITYRDLYDRRPTAEELHELLRGLNAFNTVLLLTRLNTMFRHASVSLVEQDSASLQMFFGQHFLDAETRQRLQQRFGAQNAAHRPLCYPLQLLAMIRLSLVFCEGADDARPDISDAHRHRLGAACLMMGDLFLSPEEFRNINEGAPDDRRKQLMVQFIPQFEIDNPTRLRNLLFRSYAMYRIVLQDPILLDRIKRECGGLDIEKEFEQLADIPMVNWLSLVFGVYVALAIHTQQEFLEKPEIFIMNRKNFVANPAISQAHIDEFFELLSLDFDELRAEIRKERPVDERFDLVPFKSTPLWKTAENNYVCVDFSLVSEKLHNGTYFMLSSRLPEDKRWRIHNAWGLLFEAYVNWLLKSLDGQDSAEFYPDTCWQNGARAFDAVLRRKKVVVAIEYKGGFLRQDARYSSNADAFMRDLDGKISEGCFQLARNIAELFPTTANGKNLRGVPIPSDAFCVLPVLVVQDSILRTPFVNYFLNKRFQTERDRFPSKPQVKILPLNVIQITQLETLVEMAETFGTDFIDTLHKRCNIDPIMGVDLQDFISRMPESKQMRCSKRFDEMMTKSQEEMETILFGAGYRAESGQQPT